MQPNPSHLRDSFLYYTECQLATVEGLEGRKSTTKLELKRHRLIANGMVEVCRQMLVSVNDLNRIGTPRLKDLLFPKSSL